MEHLEIILPVSLLFLAFILKLSIDRSIETPNMIQSICELPVDMIFLAISFLVAYTISNPSNPNNGLFYTISFIGLAVINVILWRKSLKLYDNGNWRWILLFLLNTTLSVLAIIQSMTVLLNK